jgi:hypothetical protein
MGLRPLDDKSDIFHNEGSKENGVTFLSLRGGPKSDAAIYRVSEDAGVLSLRVVRTSGSPRAYALAMTRVGGFVLRRRTVRVYISLFTVQTSLFLH